MNSSRLPFFFRFQGHDSDNDLLNAEDFEGDASSSEEETDFKKLRKAAQKSAEIASHRERLEERKGLTHTDVSYSSGKIPALV